MRIAVIYSGLLRRPIQNFASFKTFSRNSNFEFDIYLCCWIGRKHFSPNPSRVSEGNSIAEKFMVRKIFQPKALKFSPIESWSIYDLSMSLEKLKKHYPWGINLDKQNSYFFDHLVSNNISMWKSINDGFILMENHLKLTGKDNYDYVVRARTDVFPTDSILNLISKLNSDSEILIPNSVIHPKNEINDWFAIGKFNAMKIYCSLFQEIEIVMRECLRKHDYWTNEAGLYMYLNKQKIRAKKMSLDLKFR